MPSIPVRADGEPPLRLGGMALRNGLLIHGPTHWAAAVRASDGEIHTASGRKPRLRAVDSVPGVRGVVKLGEALAVIPLVARALPEARLPFQDSSVLAVAAATSAAGTVVRRRRRTGVGAEAVLGALSLLPAMLALRSGELAQYHGAEHKAIAAYERNEPDAAAPPKEHERCGSHLVAPMLVGNVAGAALLHRVLERPGPAANAGVALASTALAVELFGWCEKHADSALARAVRAPGFALQRVIGTREPDERQLAVSRAALGEILRAEGATA